MVLKKTITFLLFFSLYSCSDYQAGYKDGYEGIDKRQWLVFGRGDYIDGYQSGEAEKFQQDWVSEYPVEIKGLQCRSIIINADPFMLLPTKFKEISSDIYSF